MTAVWIVVGLAAWFSPSYPSYRLWRRSDHYFNTYLDTVYDYPGKVSAHVEYRKSNIRFALVSSLVLPISGLGAALVAGPMIRRRYPMPVAAPGLEVCR